MNTTISWSEKRIREEIKRLDTLTGLDGASLPIMFGNASGTLGEFWPRNPMRFRFSNYWFQNPEWPTECALDVIRHEYAHYMDWELYGGSGHGASWKKCCFVTGAAPTRLYQEGMEKYHREKHRKENELIQNFDSFSVGDLVLHPKYQFGTVEAVEGEGAKRYVLVAFETSGSRRLSAKWVIENCAVESVDSPVQYS